MSNFSILKAQSLLVHAGLLLLFLLFQEMAHNLNCLFLLILFCCFFSSGGGGGSGGEKEVQGEGGRRWGERRR